MWTTGSLASAQTHEELPKWPKVLAGFRSLCWEIFITVKMQQQDLIHPLSETAEMYKTMIFFFLGKWTLDNEGEIKGTEGKLTTARPGVEKGHAVRVRHVPSVEQNWRSSVMKASPARGQCWRGSVVLRKNPERCRGLSCSAASIQHRVRKHQAKRGGKVESYQEREF